MAPEDDHNTDSLVWRLGMVSKPRRCHEHPWAYRYAYETHTSHPPSPTVRPRTQYRGRLCPPRPSAGWGALQQLASVGKTSRFWGLRASEREGFKGEWTRRLWGRINTRNIEGRGNAGSFRATSEGMQWVWGNRKRRDLTASKRYWMRGNARSFTANRQMWGVLGKPRRSFEHPWAYKYA